MGSPNSSNNSASYSSSKGHEGLLPIANVARIMKKSLPSGAKISKEAKEIVQECVSEFINFITGEAADKCHREKRKTVNGDDLLWAMTILGFHKYVGPVRSYLRMCTDTSDADHAQKVFSQSSESDDDTLGDQLASSSFSEFHKRFYGNQSVLLGFNTTGGGGASAEGTSSGYMHGVVDW